MPPFCFRCGVWHLHGTAGSFGRCQIGHTSSCTCVLLPFALQLVHTPSPPVFATHMLRKILPVMLEFIGVLRGHQQKYVQAQVIGMSVCGSVALWIDGHTVVVFQLPPGRSVAYWQSSHIIVSERIPVGLAFGRVGSRFARCTACPWSLQGRP